MRKILSEIKKLAEDKEFETFFNEKSQELWMTGIYNDLKFDIYIRPKRDGKYKFIFEIPFEKKVCLFLNEEDVIKRTLKIFSENYHFYREEVEI